MDGAEILDDGCYTFKWEISYHQKRDGFESHWKLFFFLELIISVCSQLKTCLAKKEKSNALSDDETISIRVKHFSLPSCKLESF